MDTSLGIIPYLNNTCTELVESSRIKVSVFLKNIIMIMNYIVDFNGFETAAIGYLELLLAS